MRRTRTMIAAAAVARMYDVDASFIRAKAKRLGLPARYESRGQGRHSRVFTAAEVERLRPRGRGRPRKDQG